MNATISSSSSGIETVALQNWDYYYTGKRECVSQLAVEWFRLVMLHYLKTNNTRIDTLHELNMQMQFRQLRNRHVAQSSQHLAVDLQLRLDLVVYLLPLFTRVAIVRSEEHRVFLFDNCMRLLMTTPFCDGSSASQKVRNLCESYTTSVASA